MIWGIRSYRHFSRKQISFTYMFIYLLVIRGVLIKSFQAALK